MTDDKKNYSEKVLSSIFDCEDGDLETLKKDLRDDGFDIDDLTKNVRSMIDNAKRDLRHSWLVAAKRGAEKLKQKVMSSTPIKDPKAVLARVLVGEFGHDIRDRALVFNRNKDQKESSDEDIRAFLESCQSLGVLPEDIE